LVDFCIEYQNHKVAKVETLNKQEQVYNITVDKYHNFTAGKVVKDENDKSVQAFIIVQQSEMEYTPEISCLTKDAIINTPLGDYSIEQLLEMYQSDESFPVYCYDEQNKKLTVGTAHNVRYTKTDKIYEVKLDNGNSIKCTGDHKFLTRDNKWIEAKDLQSNQSLMPF